MHHLKTEGGARDGIEYSVVSHGGEGLLVEEYLPGPELYPYLVNHCSSGQYDAPNGTELPTIQNRRRFLGWPCQHPIMECLPRHFCLAR